ncbi:MAG: MBL fold metallo-hydrolase [Spirochaetales bacterium]|nr:MBL fold metallo-hydrolase [Spirochaetales bacterium]
MIKVKFWGVRGSIPCPGPTTVKYGGNTACIELRFDDRLVIIDAGSGIRELANFMLGNDLPKGPIKTQIFFSHTHWDHIMGFPFFIPIFIPGTKLDIYGPVTYENEGLEEIIGGQLKYRYFPVKHSELSATIHYHHLRECTLDLGDGLTVQTKYLNHPILCLGYKFTYKGKTVTTCYDTEPFRNLFPTDPNDPKYDEEAAREGDIAAKQENNKILQFFKDTDLLIHDSQYTTEEYNKGKVGWGHSTYNWVVNSAHKANVKTLAFFHHDPMSDDAKLDKIEKFYKNMLKKAGSNTQCFMSKEKEEIIIE